MSYLIGFGIGVLFIVAVIPISYYFDKRQSFAMGIATCGIGAGFTCYPQLSKWLIELYGWRGSLLISSGLMLNCLIFCALMKPLDGRKQKSFDAHNTTNEPGTIFRKSSTSSDILALREDSSNLKAINFKYSSKEHQTTELSQREYTHKCFLGRELENIDLNVTAQKWSSSDETEASGKDKKQTWDRILDIIDISFLWNPVFFVLYFAAVLITVR